MSRVKHKVSDHIREELGSVMPESMVDAEIARVIMSEIENLLRILKTNRDENDPDLASYDGVIENASKSKAFMMNYGMLKPASDVDPSVTASIIEPIAEAPDIDNTTLRSVPQLLHHIEGIFLKGQDENDDDDAAEAWGHANTYFADCMMGYLLYMMKKSRMTMGQAVVMHAKAIDEIDSAPSSSSIPNRFV